MNKKRYLKWMKTILFADKYTGRDISMITDTSFAVVFKDIKWFYDKGWITISKNGRKNKITFTEKGRKVRQHCYELLKSIGELKGTKRFGTNYGDLYEKI